MSCRFKTFKKGNKNHVIYVASFIENGKEDKIINIFFCSSKVLNRYMILFKFLKIIADFQSNILRFIMQFKDVGDFFIV